MRAKGKISSWNDDKGFGFITPNNGGKQIFIHITAFYNRKTSPVINQIVSYTLSVDKQGRPCAKNATRAGEQLSKNINIGHKIFDIFISILFILIVIASALANKTPVLLIPFYLTLSLITFIMYAVDKIAAQKNSWRIPENSLHFLSLAGGWPGAIIAQQMLRHKTRKRSFRLIFWLTVLLNFGVYIWWHTPSGAIILHSFINSTLQILDTIFS